MAYSDIRAEIVLTMADGYRLTPLTFMVPYGRQLTEIEEMLIRNYRVKELELETEIARLKRNLSLYEQPKKKKWYKKGPALT